ncbi:MAG TPA: hypothetical protein VGK27_11485 [Candidatus Deferrimicrobiaceae bacterium]
MASGIVKSVYSDSAYIEYTPTTQAASIRAGFVVSDGFDTEGISKAGDKGFALLQHEEMVRRVDEARVRAEAEARDKEREAIQKEKEAEYDKQMEIKNRVSDTEKSARGRRYGFPSRVHNTSKSFY